MRQLFLALVAPLALWACDTSDPLGLYAEPATEVVAPLKLTGRVTDAADVLTSAQEQRLIADLAEIETQTLAQLVVVTTPSLDGRKIEDYSLALGRGWGIGDAERDDGLLMVVAPNERQVRIEVGYGLENTVSDVFAKQVIDDMTPHFSKGQYNDGIVIGVDRLRTRLSQAELEKAA